MLHAQTYVAGNPLCQSLTDCVQLYDTCSNKNQKLLTTEVNNDIFSM